MLSAMAPHGREMSQDLRKKIIYLHEKGEGYKKISKALLISQNTVAKVVQTFKKDGTATISQRRPGRPRKLTPRQERLLMRRVEENQHASSLQLSKEVESQIGVTISHDTIRRTLQRNGMHGCHPRKKPSPKAQAQKSPPRVCQDPCWQRWRLLGLYTLKWWDQDKCFWNWWLQNCMASQRWGIQRKMHGAYSETWWWQCPYVGLHECCWCRGAAFHWWHQWIHKCTALYWKRRCYHHSVPLVVVHFSNMTMILNTHLRPLLDFWRRTGWKWFSGQVCLLIWTQSNIYGEFLKRQVEHHSPSSIQSKRGHSWRMEKDRSGKMSPTCSFHA